MRLFNREPKSEAYTMAQFKKDRVFSAMPGQVVSQEVYSRMASSSGAMPLTMMPDGSEPVDGCIWPVSGGYAAMALYDVGYVFLGLVPEEHAEMELCALEERRDALMVIQSSRSHLYSEMSRDPDVQRWIADYWSFRTGGDPRYVMDPDTQYVYCNMIVDGLLTEDAERSLGSDDRTARNLMKRYRALCGRYGGAAWRRHRTIEPDSHSNAESTAKKQTCTIKRKRSRKPTSFPWVWSP